MEVGIIGISGYTGVEVYRLLRQHPYISSINVYSTSHAGERICKLYPHLSHEQVLIQELNFKLLARNEIIFLCTPNPVSQEIGTKLIANNQRFIDLSGAFRLSNPAEQEEFYQLPSNNAATLEKVIYNLPDLSSNVNGNKSIANPGCYATAATLALAPLVIRKEIVPDSVIFDGKSGLTGAGKALKASSHYVNVAENMSVYKVNKHQHIPEILQTFREWDSEFTTLQFTTALIPVKRGILMTAYAKTKEVLSEKQIREIYSNFYQDKAFVNVLPAGEFPELHQVIGSNDCVLGISYNQQNQIVTIIVVIDNLIKGASGQAIQNMNLLYNWPETAGLAPQVLYP